MRLQRTFKRIACAALAVGSCMTLTACDFDDLINMLSGNSSSVGSTMGGLISSELDTIVGSGKGSGSYAPSNSAPSTGAAYDNSAAIGGVVAEGMPYEDPTQYNTEEYTDEPENRFMSVAASPMSTFSADVDTASYTNIRSMLANGYGVQSIPPGSVRIEEMLNYFRYPSYKLPEGNEPFGVTTTYSDCPWNPEAKLLQIGLRAEDIDFSKAPPSNITLLIDTSGSMDEPNKLPLVQHALHTLAENLTEKDRISIVTYAGSSEVLLDGVRGDETEKISAAIDGMTAYGSTDGANGIETAYQLAAKSLIPDGINRVVLCTDGDFNVGITDQSSLVRLIEDKRKSGIFLSVLGFGRGNISDTNMESLADKGNGNYGYIDSRTEARKFMSEELGANFNTVAKDVKFQIEFNPAYVKGYRLIGYENRVMANEDFDDDTKDAGEIGAGHMVTALYEIIPVDSAFKIPDVGTKYQETAKGQENGEIANLKIRYKAPNGLASKLLEYPITEASYTTTPGADFDFAAAVAEAGLLLKNSQYKGEASYKNIESLLAKADVKSDPLKSEFVDLVSIMSGSSASLPEEPDYTEYPAPTEVPGGPIPAPGGVFPPDTGSKIGDAKASSTYQAGNVFTRKNIAEECLFGMEQSGEVSDISYDAGTKTFTYKNSDGSTGTWSLEG